MFLYDGKEKIMYKVLKIFIASPSNLTEEREYIRKIVDRINSTIGKRINIFLQILSWENSVYADIGADAQDVINKQINDNYDVFIGLMWDRVGSETKRALSGTIEEYERAYNKYIFNKNTKLMMYFKTSAIPIDKIDTSQIEKLKAFKKRISDDGNLYYTYSTTLEFSEMLYDQLTMMLMDYPKSDSTVSIVKDYLIGSTDNKVANKQTTALAIVYKNSILIVKRSEKLRVGAGLWQLPGGKVEQNESPLSAILREIKEELGLTLDLCNLKTVTDINSKSLGDANNVLIKMHLFYYEIEDKKLNIMLEDSIDSIKWLPFSEIYNHNLEYLGDTPTLLQLAKRYKYAYLPLQTLEDYMNVSHGAKYPKKLLGYTEETSQTLFTILDILGFIDENNPKKNIQPENKALFSVLLEWCLTNKSIFEENGNSDWQTNMLLLNSGDRLLHYQKTLFERHDSLSSLMSYKLSKVLSHRKVCDILLFAHINNKLYLLLRWDYFAEKYQIPSKGLENCPSSENNQDEKCAQFVISERFSNEIVSSFTYQYLGNLYTTHLGSGSIDNVNFVRDYYISLFLLQPHKEEVEKVVRTIESINKRAIVIMENENISKGVKKDTVSFHWVDLDTIMVERYTYQGKKLQGFSEIVDYIGKEKMLELAQMYSIDLSKYKHI